MAGIRLPLRFLGVGALGLAVLFSSGCPASESGARSEITQESCDDANPCAAGLVCVSGTCVTADDLAGDQDAPPVGAGRWAVVHLYGPPADQYPELDPFQDCDFVETCYRPAAGDDELKNCQSQPWPGPLFDAPELPEGVRLSVVARCYYAGPDGHPSYRPKAGGESGPVAHKPGDGKIVLPIYILPFHAPGPMCAAPVQQDALSGVPVSPSESRFGAAEAVLTDGTVLLMGGVVQLNTACGGWDDPLCVDSVSATAEYFHPGNGNFELVGNEGGAFLSEGRAFAAAVALPSGTVAVFGGLSDGAAPTNSVEIFDPTTRSFSPGLPMLETRAYHTATLIDSADDGRVLLVGGWGSGETSWEVWGPATGPAMSGGLLEPRRHHTATLVTKESDASALRNSVVITGGESGAPGSATVRNTIEIFDIAEQQLDGTIPLCTNKGTAWESSDWNGPDPAPQQKTLHAAAYVPKRQFIYVAGGFKDGAHKSPLRDICVWNVAQEHWHGQAGSFLLDHGRGGLTATPFADNAVALVGGLGTEAGQLASPPTMEIIFEYSSPETGMTVVDIGPDWPIPMLEPRWWHRAIPVGGAGVLVIGGLAGAPAYPFPATTAEYFIAEL
jgi:hypothetical protein